MPSGERISTIVEQELAHATPPVREAGQKIFQLLTAEEQDTVESCTFVREQIRARLDPSLYDEARKILDEIKEKISEAGMHAGLQEMRQRKSAHRMGREILSAYEVIRENGPGVVYLGSARTKPGDSAYESAKELGAEIYALLGTTAWSGAGPGQMEAPLLGAKEAGGKVAGIKINLTGSHTKFEQDINAALDKVNVACCDYFGPRKIGLADAAMRKKESDRTAIITTPGGFGTRDEFYEYVVLKQLNKLGTNFEVPIILINSNGSFELLIQDIQAMLSQGFIKREDLDLFKVVNSNRGALEYLADFYSIPQEQRPYLSRELQFA